MSEISWRASFWFCAGLGGVLTILTILCVPETYRNHAKFDATMPTTIATTTTVVTSCDEALNDTHSSDGNEEYYLKQQQKEDTTKKFNPMLPLFLLRYPHVLLSSLACAVAFGVQISTGKKRTKNQKQRLLYGIMDYEYCTFLISHNCHINCVTIFLCKLFVINIQMSFYRIFFKKNMASMRYK